MKTIIIDGTEYNLTPICKSTESEVMYNDWRLPTIEELLTLVNYEKCYPACDLEDTISEAYWSSSSVINRFKISDSIYNSGSSCAWLVRFDFGRGGWNLKSNSNLVRCVRNGENGLEWSATSEKSMTWNEAIKYASSLVAPVYYKG